MSSDVNPWGRSRKVMKPLQSSLEHWILPRSSKHPIDLDGLIGHERPVIGLTHPISTQGDRQKQCCPVAEHLARIRRGIARCRLTETPRPPTSTKCQHDVLTGTARQLAGQQGDWWRRPFEPIRVVYLGVDPPTVERLPMVIDSDYLLPFCRDG